MKILFIEHEYHKLTNSNTFFKSELSKLSRDVEITTTTEKSLKFGDAYKEYEFIVVWQQLEALKKLPRNKLKIVVPMFDGSNHLPVAFYRKYENSFYVCFSKNQYYFLKFSGLPAFQIQYFPELLGNEESSRSGIFFWERTPTFGFDFQKAKEIAAALGETLIYRPFHDPHDPKSTKSDADWFSKEDYLSKLAKARYFLAPRRAEGIGLSFLDAMSMGLVVIAHDEPTMNEYIYHNKNGVLVNLDRSLKLPKRLNHERLQANADSYFRKGRVKYVSDAEKLINHLHPYVEGHSITNKKFRFVPKGLTCYQFVKILRSLRIRLS